MQCEGTASLGDAKASRGSDGHRAALMGAARAKQNTARAK